MDSKQERSVGVERCSECMEGVDCFHIQLISRFGQNIAFTLTENEANKLLQGLWLLGVGELNPLKHNSARSHN